MRQFCQFISYECEVCVWFKFYWILLPKAQLTMGQHSAMVQAMARSRTGDKPLPESMQTEFAVAYVWPQGQVSTRQNYSIWRGVTTYIVYFVTKGPTDNGSAVVSGNGLATGSWQAITWISAEKFTTIYIWGYEEEDYMQQRYTYMASGHSLHILLRLHIWARKTFIAYGN